MLHELSSIIPSMFSKLSPPYPHQTAWLAQASPPIYPTYQ